MEKLLSFSQQKHGVAILETILWHFAHLYFALCIKLLMILFQQILSNSLYECYIHSLHPPSDVQVSNMSPDNMTSIKMFVFRGKGV